MVRVFLYIELRGPWEGQLHPFRPKLFTGLGRTFRLAGDKFRNSTLWVSHCWPLKLSWQWKWTGQQWFRFGRNNIFTAVEIHTSCLKTLLRVPIFRFMCCTYFVLSADPEQITLPYGSCRSWQMHITFSFSLLDIRNWINYWIVSRRVS